MKTLSRGLQHFPAVQVAVSEAGMYTDPEAVEVQNARAELFDRLDRAPRGSVVPLSLEGVELSASCIAAVLGPVLTAVVQKHLDGKFVMVRDPSGRSAWDGDAGLRKESERVGRKLICVWEGKNQSLELVGPVDEQVRATYEFVLEMWRRTSDGSTARDLAEHFDLTIQAASNRLAKASSQGLLFASDREVVIGGGAQFVFVPVV